jgi:hypothetical protein
VWDAYYKISVLAACLPMMTEPRGGEEGVIQELATILGAYSAIPSRGSIVIMESSKNSQLKFAGKLFLEYTCRLTAYGGRDT